MSRTITPRVTDDFLPAGFVKPVECSETLVESICIDTEKPSAKLAVTLINYAGANLDQVTVKVNGLGKAKSVRSVAHGALKPDFKDGAMVVTLPLKAADILLIDR